MADPTQTPPAAAVPPAATTPPPALPPIYIPNLGAQEAGYQHESGAKVSVRVSIQPDLIAPELMMVTARARQVKDTGLPMLDAAGRAIEAVATRQLTRQEVATPAGLEAVRQEAAQKLLPALLPHVQGTTA